MSFPLSRESTDFVRLFRVGAFLLMPVDLELLRVIELKDSRTWIPAFAGMTRLLPDEIYPPAKVAKHQP